MSAKVGIGGLALAAMLLLATGRARAQDDVAPVGDIVSIEQRAGYVEAVGRIASGEEAAGIAALEKIAALHPEDPDRFLLHYNLACGHARLGDLDAAFRELGTAVTGGYAVHPQRLKNLLTDPDLEKARADARFDEIALQAKAIHDGLQAHWDELVSPYTFVPPPPADPEEAKKPLPLLIVLHPYGEERGEYARRLFEPWCAAHRFALFAPGGQQLIAPERFAFFMAEGDFIDGFRLAQRQVVMALDRFRKSVAIDPERIYVTGAGQGAGLGFAIAMRNPQWVRGAVLFDGGYAPASLRDWVEAAVRWKRRVALVHPEDDPRYPLAPLDAWVAQLEQQGFALRLDTVPGDGKLLPEAVAAGLDRQLPWIDEEPFQRPADAGR